MERFKIIPVKSQIMFSLKNHCRRSSSIRFPLEVGDHEFIATPECPCMRFSPAMFKYMGTGMGMEDCSPKVWVLPVQLERNKGGEAENICKGTIIMVDPNLSYVKKKKKEMLKKMLTVGILECMRSKNKEGVCGKRDAWILEVVQFLVKRGLNVATGVGGWSQS